MIEEKDWKQAYASEISGGGRTYGIRIQIAGIDLGDDDQQYAIGRIISSAGAEIVEKVLCEEARSSVSGMAQAMSTLAELWSLFDGKAFFWQQIPNGYCDRHCCVNFPWMKAWTPIGQFTVGWRKRVINVDWNGTLCSEDADALFPDQDVTKIHKSIHAWSAAKAREYVARIIASGEKNIVQLPVNP